MRGRKPTPPALKVLQGQRADRINADAPEAPSGRPDAPEALLRDAEAMRAWERLCGELEALGVIAATDGGAMALYCSAYSRWVEARREVESVGLTVETPTGAIKTNPAVQIAAAAEYQMARLLIEFGLTPSARSRVKGRSEAPKDELGEFLRRKA